MTWPPDLAPRLPLARRAALALLCLLVTVAVVPRWVGGRAAGPLFKGDLAEQTTLGDGVAKVVLEHPRGPFFATGDARFDGQASLAIYQMTVLGLGQIVLDHPEKKADYLPAMRAAADALADPAMFVYAAKAYGEHAAVRMDPDEGHAYAGYINIALGMLRVIDPEMPQAALHDRLTAELSRRLFRAPNGLIETYPGETWPPDVAVVAGSIGLHARATGKDVSGDMDTWAERFEECSIHASGYLIQRIRTGTCTAVDAPRGSGTAFASYAIGFAHPGLSGRLHRALVSHGTITLGGLGGIREYADGYDGHGDMNAGPILLGASVGGTGFGLGAARMHKDYDLYRSLYRSAHLFGMPASTGDGRRFALGGALGNALLLAMLTARAP